MLAAVQRTGLPGAGRTAAGCRRRAPRLARNRLAAPRAEGPHSHGLGDGPSTSGRGAHQHVPPPPAAHAERASDVRSNAVPLASLSRSPVLRALAQSSVALPRRTLEQRYGDAPGCMAVAEPLAAPELLPAPARLASSGVPALPARFAGIQLPQLGQQGQQAAPAEEAPLSREALTLVLLATAVSFICSIDRAAMSVTILPMGEQFGWDDAVKGSVSSAFFAGYMITNLCGGFLATRYSAKGVLALGVVLWSCFTIATPAAASGNLPELMMARAAMGVGEGVTYPSIQNLARRWVPEQKRSRALAFIYSGHQLGTIGSYLLCPLLISQLGWESVFWIFGSLGFVWLLGWLPLVADEPPASTSVPDSARTPAAALAAAAPGASSTAAAAGAASAAVAAVPAAEPLKLSDVPWAAFAQSPAFWAIVAAQCTVSVGNVLAFSWLPTFYNQVYGVDVVASSIYTVMPFVVTVAATNAAGWIADGLVNNKVLDKTSTRKLMQAIAGLGPAACLLKLAADQGEGSVGGVADAAALVTAWVSLCGFSAAGYGSNHQDISAKYSGILYGLSNGLASVAASVSIYATGQVLHTTHDWSLVFEVAAGLYAVGALAYIKWASCEEQFEPLAAGARAGADSAAAAKLKSP